MEAGPLRKKSWRTIRQTEPLKDDLEASYVCEALETGTIGETSLEAGEETGGLR